MKGLELSRRFWEEAGRPAFLSGCPEIFERGAVGLVGEGSDCFGFDDEISRDHDWGPGFCVWLTAEDDALFGDKARAVYASLPEEFYGFRRIISIAETASRIGVHETGAFFTRYIGLPHPPETVREWRFVPEEGLSVLTNGEVFFDNSGEFSRFRSALLEYYPESLRLKKLAAACAFAAQSGQYNYYRCKKRGEAVAAFQALGIFVTQVQRIVFLLNRRYMPYYKWTHRALRSLPLLGESIAGKISVLTSAPAGQEGLIESISAEIIGALVSLGLSDSQSDFLLPHAESVQAHIEDASLRNLHLMSE